MKRLRFLDFWLLWLGLVLTIAMGSAVATPVVWHLTGAPPESYPELFFLAYGMPPALLVLLAGVIQAWLVFRARRASSGR